MTDARCVVCGGLTRPAFVTTDRNRRIDDTPFLYLRCEACGTLCLDAPPSDIGRYYPQEYYDLPDGREALLAATARERYKVDLIRRFVPAGRLVEIGPAIGGFAVNAQEAGYDTTAVEMDARSASFLRDVLGIPCAESDDPAAIVRAQRPYDVIALWHVLEHLPDPMAMLEAAAEALAPGGVLALAVPNPEAFQLRVLGSHWAHIDAPRHLFLMPARELVRRGAALGLEPVLVTFRDAGTLFWNRFGWRESLGAWGRGRYARRALKAVGEAVAVAAIPLDRRAGRGATFTLLLRRPAS